MKKLILLSLVVSSLLAVEMKVKKGEVIVSINAQKVSLQKGDVKELAEGTTICYLSGKGKVAFAALKKQLKKPKRCLMIPISESSAKSFASDIKNKLTIAFWDSSESVRHGAGTKGETEYESEGAFVLTPEQNELVIYGKEFGPLPVSVVLTNKEGNEVAVFENEESEVTLFRISRYLLENEMKLEIFNGFEELMLSKKIVVEGK